jgi:hypothetical protein
LQSSTLIFYVVIYHFDLLMMYIPLWPAYDVYISQLIQYARDCSAHKDFSKRGKLLTIKFMVPGYNESPLKSSFCKPYSSFNKLMCGCKLSLAHILNYMLPTFFGLTFLYCLWGRVILYSWFLLKDQGGCIRSAEDAYSSISPDLIFAFVGGLCCPVPHFVLAFWIMCTLYTLLTSLFSISQPHCHWTFSLC